MTIKLSNADFNPWQEIQARQTEAAIAGKFGATSIFVGTMRDFNQGDAVQSMILEYYPGMTEKQLNAIIDAAKAKWTLLDVLVVHRVGEIFPNQPIVVVATWAAHRGDAFDACRYLMENLKSKAPFWKKEQLTSEKNRWLTKNSDGYQIQPFEKLSKK